jgi:hypothetical protein
MHALLKTALAAALALIPTEADAQEHAPDLRFRYLGRVQDFAVMATEATGPQTERKLTIVLASRTASGPGGIDNLVWRMRIDCTVPRFGIYDSYAYLGAEQRRELHDADGSWASVGINMDSANGALVRFACTGEAIEKEARWLKGDAAARAFALERIHEN